MWTNLHFLHPEWFWLLLAIPLLWGLRWAGRRHTAEWERLVDRQLMPFVLTGGSSRLGWIPLTVLSLALALAIVAMTGPAWEKREVPVFRNQQALVIAMDFSSSMYAEDEKPNRLTLERFKLLDLLKSRQDGQTGLVVFAGDAFVVSPLTDDTATIAEQAKNLTPEIMPAQGSRAAPAIERSIELLRQAGVTRGHILLMTDGATDAAEAADMASEARRAGYGVSVLAIGTKSGAPVPRERGGFLLDGFGKTVVAKVDFDRLQGIAEAGGGRFVHAALGDTDLDALSGEWKAATDAKLTEGQGRQVDAWVNEGYWLVLLLLPLAALAFRRGWVGALLLCVLLPQPQPSWAFGWDDLWSTPDQQGQEALHNGQPGQAAQLFQDPQWKGAAAYKSGDYAVAAQLYSNARNIDGLYNYGNTLAKLGKLPEAIQAYDNVLKADPKHDDARYNRDLLQKALEQQGQQQQSSQQQDQQQQQNGQQQQSSSGQQQQQQSGQQNQQQQGQQGQQQDKQQAGGQGQQQQRNQQQQNSQDQSGGQQKQKQDEQGQSEQQKQGKQEGQEQQKQKQERQAAGGKENQDQGQDEAGEGEQDERKREQQQATEQWLRRIPDDPAGLWRRKFQYQYQQRGGQVGGEEW